MMTTDQARTAVVFPGMGPSRFTDVGKFMMIDPFVRKRLAAADEALGRSVLDGFRTAGADFGEFAQIACFINSVALADRAVETQGLAPDVCAGFSFGQKAATAFSGALPFTEAVRLTYELALCEKRFFEEEHQDLVTLTLTRVPDATLQEVLGELSERGEFHEVSGRLDEGMHMVTMREQVLESFQRRISAVGGYSLYSMKPPAHCRILSGLRARAEEEVLAKFDLADPELPVVADHDGSLVMSADQMRTLLLDTFDHPVRWHPVVDTLRGMGVTTVHVTGSDRLIHRLDVTTRAFDVVALGPEQALRPARPAARSASRTSAQPSAPSSARKEQ
ncbi:ACP S-malonyltransferase [Streptomyces aurantiacus]|uniref:[acyl-carrier-protein] S-malonyltransferase n=1 Tax=Streptomyces aurantiacus JA 4570 TaxID=1286094 RepID=S3ZJN6_9ACTN|nr:ACP S-malonyltransferase [Streptomyces aurantiacus]EPH42959.1 putative Malonyl CoA-acyl carrier protein transacylase [Streptomyces aurantiacus JA 4570]